MGRRSLGLVALLAAGCAAAATPAATPGQARGTRGPTRLLIELSRRPELPAAEFTLECDPPAGSLPDPVQACAAVAQAPELFAPVPPGQLCTQLYGGPETAAVRGVHGGRDVGAVFNRRNGCEIARFQRLMQALGLAAR